MNHTHTDSKTIFHFFRVIFVRYQYIRPVFGENRDMGIRTECKIEAILASVLVKDNILLEPTFRIAIFYPCTGIEYIGINNFSLSFVSGYLTDSASGSIESASNVKALLKLMPFNAVFPNSTVKLFAEFR